jgi:superfamily I DNA and/or RNA helicase
MEKLVALHPEAVVLLEEQYRMHEDIMGFSARTFYNNRLIAHASVARHVLHGIQFPFTFIDTAGCGFEEKREGTRLSNPEEAAFVLQYLSRLVATVQASAPGGRFPSVAIISPYKQQVELLKDLVYTYPVLKEVQDSISVNTIDSFQGQERDLVVISMTRTNTENNIGFLSDTRRMNVAMTRARKALVIAGDSATLSVLPFYADMIAYSQEKGGYVSAWEFME